MDGVKKTGPTIRQIQEEYGGAGKFYIPEEEHYLLENEDWRWDKWPEFYQGKNVADFYDPEIEQKLQALEEEEERILQMEGEDMIESSSDEGGIADEELKRAVDRVRGKISLIKQKSLMKKRNKVHNRNTTLEEVTKGLEEKGIKVNKESLQKRARSRRSIASLEAA